jgi:ubiquinone/menaquinone biosynthesis C-methylase UbiE
MMRSGFDWLARPYRWMEYASFGRALERSRLHFLPALAGARNMLVLGDGDGRFAASLLTAAPGAHMVAVDGSSAMLQALRDRCTSAAAGDRVVTLQADLAQGLPQELRGHRFDVVATHFFLDCLSDAEVNRLAGELRDAMEPGGCWVVSEFAEAHGIMRLPSRAIVRALYLSFRWMTGLGTQRLPKYRAAFHDHGFTLTHQVERRYGLLVAEMWHCMPATVDRGVAATRTS